MTSITQQKQDLRALIHRKTERYLKRHPDRAAEVAMGAVKRLSSRMTLTELKQWHLAVYSDALRDIYDNALKEGGKK